MTEIISLAPKPVLSIPPMPKKKKALNIFVSVVSILLMVLAISAVCLFFFVYVPAQKF
jgi:hypothetical protein